MAVFYILPPRPLVGKRFSAFLEAMLPGLHWSENKHVDLAEAVSAAAAARPDVFVVFREDLPDVDDTEPSLRFLFGAETGDVVVEVRAEDHPNEMTNRRWQIQPLAA